MCSSRRGHNAITPLPRGALERVGPLLLAPVALAILGGYSLAKRFTWATHLWLGVCLGGAPAGAWIAITNSFGWRRCAVARRRLLGRRLRTIIYATQTSPSIAAAASARSRPLRVAHRFRLSRAARRRRRGYRFGVLLDLGIVYGAGVAVIAARLAYEQRIVSPDESVRVDRRSSIQRLRQPAFAHCAIVEAIR